MIKIIIQEIKNILIEEDHEYNPSLWNAKSPLIGESHLDSMNIVSLCLRLEDIAEDQGFEFDWTSEKAMSQSKSMFRSVESLAEEFLSQKEKS